MEKTHDYVRRFLLAAERSGDAWNLVGQEFESDDFSRQKMESTLEYLGEVYDLDENTNQHLSKQIELANKYSFSSRLYQLAPAIVSEINRWTDNQHRSILDNTRLIFAPLRSFAAFCVNTNEFREPLDGNVIFVNQALYFCTRLIAKAVLDESMQGDFAHYSANGKLAFQAATRLLAKPSVDDINASFYRDIPADDLGQIEAVQSHATMIVLCFVVLHELGHLVNNDLELLEIYQLQATSLMGVDVEQMLPENLAERWAAEYKADEFAVKILSQKAASPMEAWANFSQVYAFFKWIDYSSVAQQSKSYDTHPRALDRAEKMREVLSNEVFHGADIQEYFLTLNRWSEHWSQP